MIVYMLRIARVATAAAMDAVPTKPCVRASMCRLLVSTEHKEEIFLKFFLTDEGVQPTAIRTLFEVDTFDVSVVQ